MASNSVAACAPPAAASPSTLAAWLARLEARPRTRRENLGCLRAVADRLGVRPPAAATVVVAGTNGKGSTVAFLERLLLAGGRTAGVTTSPHLHRFNERVRLNGRCVSDADLVEALADVEAARADVPLSYFDHATLAALRIIARARVDVAVLEVGLGGRLDAVNTVDADVAVVTNIGLDHQQQLGGTRESIAAQKAGVARRGRPLVVGEPAPPSNLLATARALGASIRLAGRDFGHDRARLWIRRRAGCATYPYAGGAVDAANAATALQAASLLGPAPAAGEVAAAAGAATNPGRFEVAQRGDRVWVLDVAHNPAAARFLAAQLRARFGGRFLGAVVGCMADKDVAGIVAPLKPLLRCLAFTDTAPPRGQSAGAARRAAREPTAFAAPLDAALAHLETQIPANGVILACGSFDLIERMRVRLHLVAAAAASAAPTLAVSGDSGRA